MISDTERDDLLREVEDLDNVIGVAKMSTKARPVAIVSRKKDEADLDNDQIVANNASRSTGVLEVGDLHAHAESESEGELDIGMPEAQGNRKNRHRPTQAGLSGTNINSTACTMTGIAEVTDPGVSTVERDGVVSEGQYVYVFNGHCAARGGDALFGSSVVQPSPYDGGTRDDRIGGYCGWVPIEDGVQTDYSEATIEDLSQASTAVHNLGEEYGTEYKREAYESLIGTEVVNSGRTVGVRRSIVRAVGATVPVGYGGGETIRTENAVITKPPEGEPTMSEGGQSGAPVFSEAEDGAGVGVLYAGSDQATIFATIAATEELAGVRFLRSDEELTEDDPGDGGDDGDDEPTPPDLSWWEWILRLLRRESDGESRTPSSARGL